MIEVISHTVEPTVGLSGTVPVLCILCYQKDVGTRKQKQLFRLKVPPFWFETLFRRNGPNRFVLFVLDLEIDWILSESYDVRGRRSDPLQWHPPRDAR